MYIGIIGAMEEEITKLKEIMDIEETVKISDFVFYIGKIYNKDVVLVKSNEGKVNSAICTQTMILNFKIKYILNVGVAGALDEKLDVGGIAISKNTVQFDLDTTALGYELGYTFGLNKVYVECEEKVYNKIYNISSKEYNTVLGTILSSDKFVSDDKLKNELKNKFKEAIAVDMETASISHVCKVNNIPFCAIRAISDNTKEVEYRKFLSIATENLYKVVTNYIKTL